MFYQLWDRCTCLNPSTCTFFCFKLDDVKGIPEFWLTAMKNVDMLAEMIQVCKLSALLIFKLPSPHNAH